MSQFERNFFEYFNWMKRSLETRSLLLGGYAGSGGGGGGPPGGFIGYLPQTRVSYDLSEIGYSGLVSVSGSLLDNLNHIRYRIDLLESGLAGGLFFEEDDIPISSNITIVNFEGIPTVTNDGGGKVTVTVQPNFLDLTDTPNDYVGDANKIVAVNASGNGLEFIPAPGVIDSCKVLNSPSDTTEDYLDRKIVAGSGLSITTISGGGNEHLEVSLPRQIRIFGAGDANIITSGNLGVRILAPYAGEITNILASLTVPASGSSVILDVYKNGTTIFTTPANRPTIAAGDYDDLTSVPDTVYFVENDVFTFYVAQPGALYPGSGLTIQVRSLI